MRNGRLFIISGPSGSGKSTLITRLLAEMPGLAFSVSHTTRTLRTGEKDGVHYYFVSQKDFLALRDESPSGFLEWAEVHGNFYGTSVMEVEKRLAQGLDIVLDIDVQGARQVRACAEAVSIFISPPSLAVLERRLQDRGSENEGDLARRLADAREELRAAAEYAYFLVNERVEEALLALKSIIIAERLRARRSPAGQAVTVLW